MTARVYAWPRHLRANCPENGSDYRCEGSLPSDCPGERMNGRMPDLVYAGELNYIRGPGWVRPGDTQWRSNE